MTANSDPGQIGLACKLWRLTGDLTELIQDQGEIVNAVRPCGWVVQLGYGPSGGPPLRFRERLNLGVQGERVGVSWLNGDVAMLCPEAGESEVVVLRTAGAM